MIIIFIIYYYIDMRCYDKYVYIGSIRIIFYFDVCYRERSLE